LNDVPGAPAATRRNVVLRGIGGSPFIAVGRVQLLDRRKLKVPKYHIRDADAPYEVTRLREALDKSERQLIGYKERLYQAGTPETGTILDAYLLMLRDDAFSDGARVRIEEELINAEWAVRSTVKELRQAFEELDDAYFRERRSDVDFIGERVLHNLMGRRADPVARLDHGSVLVAHDLSPADTASMMRHRILGFATDLGASTSHTAILARELGIPAVVGLENVTEMVGNGDLVIVDGVHGVVILHPDEGAIALYTRRRDARIAFEREILKNRDLAATTRDGVVVELRANLELVEQLASAVEHGAHGIGLVRTEFMYMDREFLPSAEEHYLFARKVMDEMAPYPVTFRTVDIGGDKLPRGLMEQQHREENPALGLRGIRLYALHPEVFQEQLRGLLRAVRHAPVHVMLPMVSGLAEWRGARWMIEDVCEELRRTERLDFSGGRLKIGAMIEMPSAVMMADVLARECDFFSVGTNDLIQYALGIDRTNEHVAYLYHPLHPAILRMLRQVAAAGQAASIPVSVCGEMASVPMYTMVLLGLGYRELSMTAASLPAVKFIVRDTTMAESEDLAKRALACSTFFEVEDLVREEMLGRFPRLFQDET
jgi:phosphotransferase system enzyme I (PtsI)